MPIRSRYVRAGFALGLLVSSAGVAAQADEVAAVSRLAVGRAPDEAPSSGFDVSIGRLTKEDYLTPRYEPAGLPLIGGNSDTGLQLGGAATLIRFAYGARPYAWKMDLVVKASVGGVGTAGSGIVEQSYLWQWDVPDLAGGGLRLTPQVLFQRATDQGYYGLGNASSAVAPPGSTRFFQYLDTEARARQLARIRLGAGFDLALVAMLRAESPGAYPGSRLARDAASKAPDGAPRLQGIRSGSTSNLTGIGVLAAGIIYDTRDNETFPRSGSFHQVGLRIVEGVPGGEEVDYGGFGANFAWMFPLFHRSVVLATRIVVDLELGDVPFYDLYKGGPFQLDNMIGGSSGVRGVPIGRYLGRIKAMGNVELRSLPVEFHLFHQDFHLGGDVLFDTGRLWLDYTFRAPQDGSGVGLKYGVGGGVYALWGQAALFRVDLVYSPDQVAQTQGFPIAVYVDQGVMF